MYIAATVPARSDAGASTLIARNEPSQVGPRPTPATTQPMRKTAAVLVATATNVSTTPRRSPVQPNKVSVCELTRLEMLPEMAALPQQATMTAPPHRRFLEPTIPVRSPGPSER